MIKYPVIYNSHNYRVELFNWYIKIYVERTFSLFGKQFKRMKHCKTFYDFEIAELYKIRREDENYYVKLAKYAVIHFENLENIRIKEKELERRQIDFFNKWDGKVLED